jgi:hypothetical protein
MDGTNINYYTYHSFVHYLNRFVDPLPVISSIQSLEDFFFNADKAQWEGDFNGTIFKKYKPLEGSEGLGQIENYTDF